MRRDVAAKRAGERCGSAKMDVGALCKFSIAVADSTTCLRCGQPWLKRWDPAQSDVGQGAL